MWEAKRMPHRETAVIAIHEALQHLTTVTLAKPNTRLRAHVSHMQRCLFLSLCLVYPATPLIHRWQPFILPPDSDEPSLHPKAYTQELTT